MPLPDDVERLLKSYNVPEDILTVLNNEAKLRASILPKPPGVDENEVRFSYGDRQVGSAYVSPMGNFVLSIGRLGIDKRYPIR